MKNLAYYFLAFSIMTMIGSLTLMFTEPQHILLATYVFVLATILGAVVLLTLDKR